jgi:hypothetical protein
VALAWCSFPTQPKVTQIEPSRGSTFASGPSVPPMLNPLKLAPGDEAVRALDEAST